MGLTEQTFHAAWDALKSWMGAQLQAQHGAELPTFGCVAWPSAAATARSTSTSAARGQPLFLMPDALLKEKGLQAGEGVGRASQAHAAGRSESLNYAKLVLKCVTR